MFSINNIAMAQAVQKAAKPKFRGQKVLKSKVHTNYPEHMEREYVRLVNAYMTILNQTLKEHLPAIRHAIDDEREGLRRDDDHSVSSVISKTFMEIQEAFAKKAETFGIAKRIANLANLNRKLSVREWKRVVSKTLGIDIMEDYYKGEFYNEVMKLWTTRNVELIRSVPQTVIANMQSVIPEGFRDGKTNTAIGKDIQEIYGVERDKAQFWARDQTSKLNADLTQAQQKDAGVEEYIWSDSGDSRVREQHKHLNGKRCRWSDPPVVDLRTGRTGHPGQDFNCLPGDTKVNLSNGCNKLFRRMYTGPIVNVVLSDGTFLQATPNHPCLTDNGWLPINALDEGDHVIQSSGNCGFTIEYNNNEFIPRIADAFEAFGRFCSMSKAACAESDFHGDGVKNNIDIIDTEGFLADYFISENFKAFSKFILPGTDSDGCDSKLGVSSLDSCAFGWVGTTHDFVGFTNEFFSFLNAHTPHPDNICFSAGAPNNAVITKDCSNNYPFSIKSFRQGKLALTGDIPFDYLVLWQFVLSRLFPVRVVSDVVLGELTGKGFVLARDGASNGSDGFPGVYTPCTIEQKIVTEFTDHVYNLQNIHSWYSITQSRVVAHNCRCVALPVFNLSGLDLPWEKKSDNES